MRRAMNSSKCVAVNAGVVAIRPSRRIVQKLRAVGLSVALKRIGRFVHADRRKARRSRPVSRRNKRSFAPLGKYAQIPVAQSKLILSVLSAPEFRVWFALCLQCQHWSNGTGKLCRSVIREFHLGSQRVVTSATKTLIAEGHIVKTRNARQRVCALYGVTHLPLNADALRDEGLKDEQVRAVLSRFAVVSATNRGSANSATTLEAPNSRNDNRGSANPLITPLALPQGKRIDPFSTSL